MLRIDVHRDTAPYKTSPENPFVGTTGYRPEIWGLGLRNPWRWSFDDISGTLMIADAGEDSWEEINLG